MSSKFDALCERFGIGCLPGHPGNCVPNKQRDLTHTHIERDRPNTLNKHGLWYALSHTLSLHQLVRTDALSRDVVGGRGDRELGEWRNHARTMLRVQYHTGFTP